MRKARQRQDRKELKKHSASVQIRNNITLLQRKLWNALLWHAYDELTTKDIHSISVQEMMRLTGYHSKDEAHLKEATLAMMQCVVEWDVLDKDGAEIWGAAVLLASAQIKNGVCSYGFAPHLRYKLYNPEMFARLDLDMQKRFESKYALALWELCTDYLGAKRDYGETPWIQLEDFRTLIGIAETMYPSFKRVREKVLSPAMAEINHVSDFRVLVEYQHQGRKVTALKFKVHRVALPPGANTPQVTRFCDLDVPPVVVQELLDTGLAPHEAWELWRQGFAAVDEAVRPAVPGDKAAAFIQYVREKIHLLQRRRATSKVDHAPGFLLQAIRQNYTNPAFDEAQQQEILQERAREVAQLQTEQAQVERARDQALQELCGQLAVEAPAVLEQATNALLAENFGFRCLYDRGKTPLENYQARLPVQALLSQALLQYAPARAAAVMAAYTTRLAALEARLAALTGAVGREPRR